MNIYTNQLLHIIIAKILQVCTAITDVEANFCSVICVHGQCNTVTQTCQCDDGYTGEDCSGIKDVILQAIEACVQNVRLLFSYLWSVYSIYWKFKLEIKMLLNS